MPTPYMIIIFSLIGILLFYIIAKIAWYIIRMLGLKSRLKKLNSGEITVSFPRKFCETMFGEMGEPNIIVKTQNETYLVSVISFASTRARWHIEKTNDGYRAQVRRKNYRYDCEYNTGTEPESAREYRRESVVHQAEFTLSDDQTHEKRILLVYPRPKELTYSNVRLEYLTSGDRIGAYTVMYADDFFSLFQ